MESCSMENVVPDICRTCLSTTKPMFSIFHLKDGFSITIKDMIMSFTSIMIENEDSYSKIICSKCLSEVLIAYSFKITCEKSDEILRLKDKGAEESTNVKIENEHFFKIEHEEFIQNESLKTESTDEDNYPLTNFTTKNNLDNLISCKISNHDDNLSDEIDIKQIRFKKKKKSKMEISKNKLKKLYECTKCHAIFKNKHMLRKHSLTVHGIYPLRKSHISDDFSSKDLTEGVKSLSYKTKSPQDIDKSLYHCTSCKFSCKTFGAFKKHNRSHTGEKPILCDECDYRCSYVAALVKHKRTHSGDKPYACEVCPYRTTTAYALRIHAATHTSDKPYACSLCSFTCKLSTSLTQHIARRHDQRKDYACETCGKCFFSSYHCKIHKRVHTGERPYACDKCGMAFSQKSNLEKHASLIHEDSSQKFPCGSCDYVARSRYTLKNHESKHSGERPLKCDMCNYRCITSSSLKLHRQRHTGDARYNCEICDYRCYTAGRLKAHKRKHTGERPYPCDLCEYRAKTDSGLRCHKLSHTNEQKYSCTNCLYKTNYRSNLTKHELKLCGRMAKQTTRAESNSTLLAIKPLDSTSPTEIKNNEINETLE